jgi:aminoglycoside phosphotransferase (APT) family kinase protein
VTRYLTLDETRTRLPFRYAITSHLPGVTVASLRDEPDIADAYRQMGALLRVLHSVRLPAYGSFDAHGIVEPVATNGAFVRSFAAYSLGRFRHHDGDGALADRLAAVLDARFDAATQSAGPVLTHDDLHPNNVLAARDAQGRLRLTGLIDFGNARAADPIFDLAKALFCSEHDAPGATGPMLEGYGTINHPDPQGALWLYTLIHRVTMWWWLRYIGVIPDGEQHALIADLREMAA